MLQILVGPFSYSVTNTVQCFMFGDLVGKLVFVAKVESSHHFLAAVIYFITTCFAWLKKSHLYLENLCLRRGIRLLESIVVYDGWSLSPGNICYITACKLAIIQMSDVER